MTAQDVMPIRLRLPGIRVTRVLRDDPDALEVSVEAICSTLRCSACGKKTRHVHQVSQVKVRDLPVLGRPTTLVWQRRRFSCWSCRATTTERHPQLDGHLTLRFRRHLVEEVVDSTVQATARRHDLGWHQVMEVALTTAVTVFFRRRRERVRVLVIDEKALRKGHNSFSTIVSNGETGKVIAVIPGRSEAKLGRFLARQPRWWREGVQVVCTDMASCCRAAIRTWLPRATHVADRFHIVKNFMALLVEARREAQRTRAGEPHDPKVFRARYMLLTRIDRLSGDQGATLAQVFAAHPHLETIWEATQRFHRVYEANGLAEAFQAVDELCDSLERCQDEAGRAISTLWRWREEWIAFHRTGGWTNAVAEGVNAKIEVLERKAYGFKNKVNHQARILLECSGHHRVNRAA